MLKTKLETSERTRMRWFKNTAARGLMLHLLCRVQVLFPTEKFRLRMANLVNYKIDKYRFFFKLAIFWFSFFMGICYCLICFLNYAHVAGKSQLCSCLRKCSEHVYPSAKLPGWRPGRWSVVAAGISRSTLLSTLSRRDCLWKSFNLSTMEFTFKNITLIRSVSCFDPRDKSSSDGFLPR